MDLSHVSATLSVLQVVVHIHFLVFLLYWSCIGFVWFDIVFVSVSVVYFSINCGMVESTYGPKVETTADLIDE